VDRGGAECCTYVAEAGVLNPGEFTSVFFLTVPPDWAGICHYTPYTCAIDSAEEALVQASDCVAVKTGSSPI